jgi:DNA invertase Pin-like site-specific DNA recombinase
VKVLPHSVDELRGKRAARWIRESTTGQVDHFGPDAQREQQDRAIERWGLVDTGIAWQVAHSGRTIASTSQWASMLAAAGDTFDVLVVGYVSRFARNLKTAVNVRDELHAAGAAVLFADDGILTSDEDAWEHWAREAVEAEAYSRRLGKRIREGYAAKRRRHADPGGHPPFGFVRVGLEHVLEPNPTSIETVRAAFVAASGGQTDREVSIATGIPIFTLRGMLRNPLYAGQLPGGGSTRFPALIDERLWQTVQAVRERRATRDGRPAKRRPYALSMLHCAACGRRLTGDTGRYRHNDVCSEFAAAVRAPKRRARGQHRDPLGASYPADVYERVVGEVLRRVSAGAVAMTAVLSNWQDDRPPDHIELARIDRERRAATTRYLKDRDAAALEAAMTRLDGETAATEARPPVELDRKAAVAYLSDLEQLWLAAPTARRAMAEAIFERIDVIGIRSIRVVPTPAAVEYGLAEAFRTGSAGKSRGERRRAEGNRLIVRLVSGIDTRIRIVLPKPAPLRIVRSA